MRFERLRIHAFGAIEGLDTGEGALPGLVVVHGPNEAGKSTFFEFLGALLYGFYPASRDTHPFAPWNGADASGEAEILLESDGARIEVQRRLLSAPTGTLVRGGVSEDLRNRTLPFVEHVPRQVFRQVFALTPGELGALEGESWARVQDRLVTGMGATDLRPPREVADELEAEAGRLWRPSRRGNQLVRDLGERARELTVRRRSAAEADRAVREAHRELAEVRRRLADARREREECRLYVERYRALLPIRDQLERIRGLEEEAGPPADLEGLPADPAARLEELARSRRGLSARLEELEAELADADRRARAYDDAARRLVEARERVRALVGRVGGLEPVRVRVAQVRQEIRDLERRIETLSAEVLTPGAAPSDPGFPGDFVPAVARDALEELREVGDAARRAGSERPAAAEPSPAGPSAAPAAAVLAVGIALTAWGVLRGSTPVTAAGAGVLAVGAALAGAAAAARRRGRSESRRIRAAAEAHGEALERRLEDARAAFASALHDVPLRPELLERPPPDLVARLERLRELTRDAAVRRQELEELDGRTADLEGELREVGEALALSLPEEPAAAAHVVGEALREAERARDAAEAAGGERGRLARERERVAGELEGAEEEEARIRERLARIGDGDPEQGLERAAERVRAMERARQLEEELRRGHPDLDEIRERIRRAEAAGEDWAVDDDTLARKKAREEELIHRIEDLSRRTEGIQKDIDHLGRAETVDEVEGELRALRSRMGEATRERDRLWLMAALLRQADRRFREEHQPDILRRAGEHLAAVTGGRYERVLVGEDRGDATFLLRGPGYPGPVEVDTPVSTGTREQVYLALRLAILDHLDRSGERLPLFMDEVLVHWDADRRGRAFDLIERVARERQVFFFTCHEEIARCLAERGGLLLALPPPA